MIKTTIKGYEGTFGSCAVFQHQLFTVLQPNAPVTDSEHMANLRKSAVETTHNQMLTNDANWRTLITEFVEYCIVCNVHQKLEKFNFTNFWEPTQFLIYQEPKKVAEPPTAGSSPGRERLVKSKPLPKNTIRDNHVVSYGMRL
jgi:hypothetical protein